jgi:hypothetical protein
MKLNAPHAQILAVIATIALARDLGDDGVWG